ncbi:MAG: helix-turn-helix domain-containing protein [Pirellulales bacterium]
MLATSEVATVLGVSEGRVRQLVVSGRLKPAGRLGVNLLFRRRDVDAFSRKKRVPGRPRKKSPART